MALPPALLEALETEALQTMGPAALQALANIFAHLTSHVQTAADTHPANK